MRISLAEVEGLVRIQTGPFGTALSASEYTDEGTPLISVGEIGIGTIRFRAETPRVDESVLQRLPQYILDSRDLVISRKGSVDRTAWINPSYGDLFLGSDAIAVRFKSADHARFYAYALQDPIARRWLTQHAGGTTMLSLNGRTLSEVPVPSLVPATQRAIAEVLGALDDKIAANRHLSQVIDDLASSLFQKRFKHAPSAPLTSIAKVNTTSISPQSEGEFRYLDISLVGNGTSESPTLTTWAEAPSRARRGVPAGSTIWSTVRPNRRSHCLILDEDPILVASTGFAVLTPSECGPAFLYETTKQKSFQDYLESVAEGSAYPAVRSSEFAKAPVTSATREERNAFEEEAGPLRALQASLERENQVLASTRDELLPLLMSGRITVGAASSRVEEVV